jgi:stage V sporulation protein B
MIKMGETLSQRVWLNISTRWKLLDRDLTNMIRGAGTLIFTNVITRALGFLFPVIITWMFIPEEFGYIRYVLTMSRLMGETITSGIPNALAQRIAASNNLHSRLVYSYNAFIAIGFLFIVIVPITYLFIPDNPIAWWMTLFVMGGLTIDAIFYAILRGRLLYNSMALYRISSNLLQLVLVGVVFWIQLATPNVVLAIYGYVYLVPIVFLSIYNLKKSGFVVSNLTDQIKTSGDILKDLFFFSLPLMISAIAFGIISGIDVVFLEKWQGFESVGVYSAIKTLTMVYVFVPLGIVALLMPKIASLSNFAKVKSYMLISLAACAVSSLAIMLVFYLFGDLIISIIYPPAYQGNLDILYILSLGMACFSVYTILSQSWIGLNKPRVPAIILAVAACINIIWDYFTIPSFGMRGIAWGLSVAYIFAFGVLSIWTFYKLRAPDIQRIW